MRILFVYPEHGRRPYFPTAIGYLASSILHVQPDAEIDIIDLNIEQEKTKLTDESYDYIFLSGLSAHFYSVEKTIEYIKARNKRSIIVLGGIIITSMPEKIIQALNADLYVLGEGDKTVQELITGLRREEILGLGYKDSTGRVIINPARPLIEDLNTIPFPAWHLFSERYMKVYMETDGLWDNAFPILASRGCPMRCNFCYRNFNGTYRSRSIDNVLDEIAILASRYNIRIITFIDEYFFVSRKKILKFCDRIHERKMKFRWSCSVRVELADRVLFDTMKKAGCYMLQVGIEHGSQKMLDAMNKKSTVEANERFLNIARESRLYVGANMIIGYPGETPETIKESEELLHRVRLPAGFHLIQAFPGTRLWEYAKEKGFIKDEIEYLRNSFNSDQTLKINFTDMPTRYILSEHERMGRDLIKLYAMNNGFDITTKIYLQTIFYLKQLNRGNIRTVVAKIQEDFKKVTRN